MCPTLPNPPNGKVIVSGNTARYTCYYGYRLQGNSVRTCNYGVWGGTQPTCVRGKLYADIGYALLCLTWSFFIQCVRHLAAPQTAWSVWSVTRQHIRAITVTDFREVAQGHATMAYGVGHGHLVFEVWRSDMSCFRYMPITFVFQ